MPQVERTALVMYSAEQMYRLVNDVRKYPEFLPGCIATRVEEESDTHLVAELTLKKGPVSKVFSTSNTMVPGSSIELTLSNGPFEYMDGGWTFTPLSPEACKIAFNLKFEFKSRLAGAAFSKMFNDLTLKQIDAFTKRAEQVYGAKSG